MVNSLNTVLCRLAQPCTLTVDFTQALWQTTSREARVWIGVSTVADFIALWLTGELTSWSFFFALLTPLGIWWLPNRLALASACLYTSQAVVSWALVGVLTALLAPGLLILAASGFWQAWCMAAFIALLVTYIRTPKAAMP